MVLVGPDQRPVVWQAAHWQEPDAHRRRLTLEATGMPLQAELSFVYDGATGFLSLQTVLSHIGRDGEIELRAATSFSFLVREPVERMIYLTGGWTEETEIQRAHPDDGVLTLETRTGKTGFEFQPYVALRTRRATCLCQIFWSGNWAVRVAPSGDGAMVSGGLNNWSFRHRMGVTGNRSGCRPSCSAASTAT